MTGHKLMAMLAVGATVAAAVSGLATAGQNNGKGLVSRFPIDEGGSEVVPNFCGEAGLTVLFEVDRKGWAQVVLRGQDQLPYYSAHINETTQATANGKSLRTESTFVDKDLRVTDNGNGTVTLLILATGVSKLYGENGKVIAMDPGQFRFEISLDSNGDEIPGSFKVIKESTGRSDDYCAAAVPILTAP